MSEFDAFENAAPTEEDPAAAFLAREQDQMAELEGEGFVVADGAETAEPNAEAVIKTEESSTADTPQTDDLTNTESVTVKDEITAEFDTFGDGSGAAEVTDMFGSVPAASDNAANDDLLDGFESVPSSDPYSDFSQTSQSNDTYAAISSVDRQLQEPEKIRVWREEQKKSLETKDAEAEVKRGEWREVAKRELEDWYRHREEQLEKSKKNNREAEAAFCQERDESLPGHEWERVTRLCEFNPKAARNSKDVSRMRSILLQLKQTPLVR